MTDALHKAKLAKLIEIEGYDSIEELMEAVFSDSVSPAICMNEGCDFIHLRAAAVARGLLGISISTSRIDTLARRSTLILTLSSSIVTCRATTAKISARSTETRSVWLTILRSYSSRICNRSRATGAELTGRRKRNSFMPLSVQTAC